MDDELDYLGCPLVSQHRESFVPEPVRSGQAYVEVVLREQPPVSLVELIKVRALAVCGDDRPQVSGIAWIVEGEVPLSPR